MIDHKQKLKSVFLRLLGTFIDIPLRIQRLWVHLGWFVPKWKNSIPQLIIVVNLFDWIVFLPFYLIDLLGISNLYQIIFELVNYKSRPLNDRELILAKGIFGKGLNYNKIRINDTDKLISARLNIAYVSFNIINCHKSMSDELFIHEMVHVWQYQNFGSVYIYKALMAQRSREGYNYGGMKTIQLTRIRNKGLLHFNFEQQGDIVQDYFLLINNRSPHWISDTNIRIDLFDFLIKDLNAHSIYGNRNQNNPMA